MAEVNPPEFLGAECYTFADFRQVFNGVVCVEGVTGTGDLLVTAAGGASVDVNVAAGSAWVAGDLNGSSGMYHVTNGASVAVTIAANGAGSSRIDRIIASVYDSQYIGAADLWAIEVVQGVAGAGVPAVPDSTRSGWLELGQVTVPASGGTPSVVSDTRTRMSTCGTAPYVDLRASAATSVANNTPTKVDLATTVHNDTGWFSVAASVVTVLVTGLYDLQINAGFATGTANSIQEFYIGRNGLTDKTIADHYNGATTSITITAGGSSFPLTAGDTIQMGAYQLQGTGTAALLTVHTGVRISRLMVRKVG